MKQTLLHSNWQFTDTTERPPYVRSAVQYMPWLPAEVPGCVHLDLERNGVIPSPFERMDELGCRWVDESDWTYKTTFDWHSDSNLPKRVIHFESLDTIAEINLNGQLIGRSDNMFVPVEIDVSELLVQGSNELEVKFLSPVRIGDERRTKYFAEEGLSLDLKQFDERAFVRKAQYMSAWDWGPRLASCGIWQPAKLLEFSSRVTSFSVFQEHGPEGSVRIWSKTEVEGDGVVTLQFGDHSVSSPSSAVRELDLEIEDPQLWWPTGMGDAHLYGASASIEGGNRIEKRIGLRTVVLQRDADQIGESFTFLVNGRPIWARGANWIPNDSFPSRVGASDYRSQMRDFQALGMNMIRVWGGGLYELEPFYDACDERGILVWQDFTYACSYYPDGDEACEVASREATHQIRRLRDRASLALWCGNNENLTMWQGKWGGAASPPRYYGEKIYDNVLPDLIAQLDPTRSYIASSPVGQSQEEGSSSNDGKYGDSHYWDVWHGRGDWVYYEDSDTRFSSEFGFASSCSLDLWRSSIAAQDWSHSSPAVRWHDKTGKAWETFFGYVTTHYPEPKTLEEWVYYSQLNQRDALRFGIEHWRRSDFCKGTLIWQFNDCWPVQSWAVQDYSRQLKPAGYELKRLYSDQLISLLRRGPEIEVYLVNDSESTWRCAGDLQEISLQTGQVVYEEKIEASIEAGQRLKVTSRISATPESSLLRVSTGDRQAQALFDEPKSCRFELPSYSAKWEDGKLTVSVRGVAVDLSVETKGYFHLSPLGSGLPGTDATTLINESVSWNCESKPRTLGVRSLAGIQVVEVD